MPIRFSWGELGNSFDNLMELGCTLQFVVEHEFAAPTEPKPLFLDARGHRFRILVYSLEVVYCAPVSQDFEISQLSVREYDRDGSRLIVELLEGDITRALVETNLDGAALLALAEPDVAQLDLDPWNGLEVATPMAWEVFDEHWFASVDPAPPLTGREILDLVFGRWRRRRS